MMKKIYLITIILATFLSCSTEKELPEGILNKEQMVDLMVDVEIAQAKLKFEFASEGKTPNYTEEYSRVFQKHKLTKNRFIQNVDYYCSEPMLMRKVYDKVIVELTEKQAELNKKQFTN